MPSSDSLCLMYTEILKKKCLVAEFRIVFRPLIVLFSVSSSADLSIQAGGAHSLEVVRDKEDVMRSEMCTGFYLAKSTPHMIQLFRYDDYGTSASFFGTVAGRTQCKLSDMRAKPWIREVSTPITRFSFRATGM
jgi:hypothetical protein